MNHQHFLGIGFKGEHGFSEEAPSYGKAIHATNQFVIRVPDFDGVRDALPMQLAVACHHVVCNPGPFCPGLGAQANDSGESTVGRNGKMLAVQRSPQALGNVDLVWK